MWVSRVLGSSCPLPSHPACFCRVKYLHVHSPWLLFYENRTQIDAKDPICFLSKQAAIKNGLLEKHSTSILCTGFTQAPTHRTFFCRDTRFSTSFLIGNVLVAGPDPNPPATKSKGFFGWFRIAWDSAGAFGL